MQGSPREILLLPQHYKPLNAFTELIIFSLLLHLKVLIHLKALIYLNLRYNPRHQLHPQGQKEKEPRKDTVCRKSSIETASMTYNQLKQATASMNYNQLRQATVRSIAILYSQNKVRRYIGRGFIYFAVHLRHSGLSCRNCLQGQLPKVPAAAKCWPKVLALKHSAVARPRESPLLGKLFHFCFLLLAYAG